jgi:hypothetical protein
MLENIDVSNKNKNKNKGYLDPRIKWSDNCYYPSYIVTLEALKNIEDKVMGKTGKTGMKKLVSVYLMGK